MDNDENEQSNDLRQDNSRANQEIRNTEHSSGPDTLNIFKYALMTCGILALVVVAYALGRVSQTQQVEKPVIAVQPAISQPQVSQPSVPEDPKEVDRKAALAREREQRQLKEEAEQERLRKQQVEKELREKRIAEVTDSISDKQILLDEAKKIKSIQFFVKRRFSTFLDRGVYEAISNPRTLESKPCVLIAHEDDVKTDSPLTYFTLSVKDNGEREYSVTHNNAFQTFETKEFYRVYQVVPAIDVAAIQAEYDKLTETLKDLQDPQRARIRQKLSELKSTLASSEAELKSIRDSKFRSAAKYETSSDIRELLIEMEKFDRLQVKNKAAALANFRKLNESIDSLKVDSLAYPEFMKDIDSMAKPVMLNQTLNSLDFAVQSEVYQHHKEVLDHLPAKLSTWSDLSTALQTIQSEKSKSPGMWLSKPISEAYQEWLNNSIKTPELSSTSFSTLPGDALLNLVNFFRESGQEKLLDDAAWALATQPGPNSIETVRAYLNGNTLRAHESAARNLIQQHEDTLEGIAWEKAEKPGEPTEWEARLKIYLKGSTVLSHRLDANVLLNAISDDREWGIDRADGTPEEVIHRLEKYIHGTTVKKHLNEATALRDEKLAIVTAPIRPIIGQVRSANDVNESTSSAIIRLCQVAPATDPDIQRLKSIVILPPFWAETYGHDNFGFWADLRAVSENQSAIQRFRFIRGGTVHTTNNAEARVADFWLANTECTQEIWQVVMRSNPSVDLNYKPITGPRLPVTNVSLADCDQFLAKIRALPSLRGASVRLPKVLEWQYAELAGTDGNYGRQGIELMAWYDSNSSWKLHEVALKKPNPWGLYDIIGNVAELCDDNIGTAFDLGDSYITKEVNPLDPHGSNKKLQRPDLGFRMMIPDELRIASSENQLPVNQQASPRHLDVSDLLDQGPVMERKQSKSVTDPPESIARPNIYDLETVQQFQRGLMYANGVGGVRKDLSQAAIWLRKAAEKNHAEAQYNLAILLFNGWGVLQDREAAIQWYSKSAKLGCAEAQYNLGTIYSNGLGVQKDDIEAARLYKQSAAQGNKNGQYNLGVYYMHGIGVEKDLAEAARLFKLSSDQGHIEATNNLGCMYVDGVGVPKDRDEGIRLLRNSASQGNENSKRALKLNGE